MDREIAKALNSLSKKINDANERIDAFFNGRCNDITDLTEEYVADLLYKVCLLELGIDEEDFGFDDEEEEE